jgi:hypothetical protein
MFFFPCSSPVVRMSPGSNTNASDAGDPPPTPESTSQEGDDEHATFGPPVEPLQELARAVCEILLRLRPVRVPHAVVLGVDVLEVDAGEVPFGHRQIAPPVARVRPPRPTLVQAFEGDHVRWW